MIGKLTHDVCLCTRVHVQNEDLIKAWCRKMAPPLVTLLGAEPEIQYVALRNINLIVQKRPYILSNEVKVFFCKYNDPIYVKMEKLEIMIRLATDKNIDQVNAKGRGESWVAQGAGRPCVAQGVGRLCMLGSQDWGGKGACGTNLGGGMECGPERCARCSQGMGEGEGAGRRAYLPCTWFLKG